MIKTLFSIALAPAMLLSAPAFAQSGDGDAKKEPRRVRIGLGAQVVPSFPGSGDVSVRPLFDVATARGAEPFDFEANDESAGFPLLRASGFEVGPAINIEGSRRRRETGISMDEVGTTIEAGGFAQLWLGSSVRVRIEGRKGLNGHGAWVGSAGADFVARDGDRYVFSIGPRVRLSDRDYQTTYFGVNTGEAARTGLRQYRPGGGVHAVGVSTGLTYALGERWGVIGFAQYDRLVGDAAKSPFIRAYGKRDQLSGGLGLTYTFGRR